MNYNNFTGDIILPRRPDAELVKTSKFRELEFYIMRKRNESIINADMQIDLTNTYKFLEKHNKDKKDEDKFTIFHIFLAAAVRTITLRPKINRFVSGRRLWQRNRIILSFVVNKEKTEASEEVNAMIDFDPFDTLESVQEIVNKRIYEARHEENPNQKDIDFWGGMPRFIIRFMFWLMRWTDERNMPLKFIIDDMPLWCSCFIAHLGSINIDSVFHHLFELGTGSVLLTIGKIHKTQVVNQETEEVEIKEVMDIRSSIDDRIASGIYTGPTFDLLKNLIENPEPLLKPPELTDEQLDALMLKKYKKDRLKREKLKKKAKRKK
ncbi:MAG: hypothetical protein FK733_00610 [Asgard group archaeon]|nr:hypothetical protein [Asgard group archaeon]